MMNGIMILAAQAMAPMLLAPSVPTQAVPDGLAVVTPGSDRAHAIKVDDVGAEYVYLRAHGWRATSQSLVVDGPGRAYDVLRVGKGKAAREVWFDISGFYGKGMGL